MEYSCKPCNYSTNNISLRNRHLKSNKHIQNTKPSIPDTKEFELKILGLEHKIKEQELIIERLNQTIMHKTELVAMKEETLARNRDNMETLTESNKYVWSLLHSAGKMIGDFITDNNITEKELLLR